MNATSRSLSLLLAATAVAVAVSGCGNTKLSDSQRAGLQTRADSLQAKIQAAGDKAQACATETVAKTKGAKGIGACLGAALTTTADQIQGIDDYVNELAGSVSGDCKDSLNTLSDALTQTTDGLRTAAATAKKGDLEGIGKELNQVTADQVDVQSAGREADKACGG